jgi:ParB family chromosome partitioning protein
MTKRTLGRGLSELLSSAQIAAPTLTNAPVESPKNFLAVDLLQPGKYQPRREFQAEALQELADSISAQGILQPILVRAMAPNRYEIIAGERRWRAAQLAGLHQVPVFIRDISDEAAVAMSLIENIQREDLNVMEQAIALKRLGDEFTMTHEAIAAAVGKSRVSISNLLRLLQLAAPVKAMLESGELEMGHARALLALDNPQQIQIAQKVVDRGLSVRETEQLVRQLTTKNVTAQKTNKVNPDVARLQSDLSDKLGAMVRIQHTAKGKGKLVVHYHSLDELEGVLAKLR